MCLTPIGNGGNGGERDEQGRFLPGNPGGPGNPHMRRVAAIRQALFDAVSNEDVTALVKTLLEHGKAGDVAAAREVLDRLLGKPKAELDVSAQVAPRPDHSSLIAMAFSKEGFRRLGGGTFSADSC